MTTPTALSFVPVDLDSIATAPGRVVVFAEPEVALDQAARRVNRLTKGALQRFLDSPAFAKMEAGATIDLAWPVGMAATAVQVVKLGRRTVGEVARQAGVAIGAAHGEAPVLVLAAGLRGVGDVTLGAVLRAYDYADQRTGEKTALGALHVMVPKPDEMGAVATQISARAQGVFFTRDLVNAPANVLTTIEFATQLEALRDLGIEVEVLDEPELERLGMRTLLAVGVGSDSPSKVVVMQWKGGADKAPFALIGKGVVFDTGGISIKPAGGMEDMTMDMGGAGVVAGVMKTLALRGAKANIVGVVGLVENMPDGRAQRPGDVVVSMKGDTVEVINTDAEGRLVLCDVMWYAQERFKPTGMIDLATLTGAIIIGLGHDNAGVFSNDDTLCNGFLKAAGAEGEGAWRMPLGKSYAKQLKSRIADVKNVGGRPAGSITAAEFLHRFVKDGTPWIHLDIAGVASTTTESTYAPKGASGWGVLALDRLIADTFEG